MTVRKDAGLIGLRDAKRIANVVTAYENGNRSQRPIKYRTQRQAGSPVRLGKTTAAWSKGTTATVTIYEEGTPPNETSSSTTIENCVNKFANVASGKWVIVARGGNGYWYLISAECG